MSRHHNRVTSEFLSQDVHRGRVLITFWMEAMCMPAIPPEVPGLNGKDMWDVSQAGATAIPTRCLLWSIRELGADNGAL